MTPTARRQTAAVYRRRRFVALLIVLAVVGGITWLAIARPWEGGAPAPAETTAASTTPAAEETTPAASETPAASDTTAASETPAPTETTPAAPTACDPALLQVQGLVDRVSFAADQNPRFAIALTNTGPVDCILNVGTTTQRFEVTSGSDVWWRSTDCQEKPADQEAVIKAGQTVRSAETITWDRTRSSADSCGSTDRPRAPGGGASYHLAVSIAGVDSASTTQFLLN